MIYDFLNVRYSTRKLTDEQFENIIEQLAEELTLIDYKINHTSEMLKKDWEDLKKFKTTNTDTSSTTRVGMKLCENFFPNFYDIKNSKGKSFANSWTKDNLIKILRWNRKSHSTPYMSEIKRGVYFCTGLTKNTMFRPHIAKLIVSSFDGETVLDPCAGWGGRMIGTVAAGKKYIGFETNIQTYTGLKKLADFLNINDSVTLYNTGAENMSDYLKNKVDIVLTSPPYFNLEIYADNKTQSENQYHTYSDWFNHWLKNIITLSIQNLSNRGTSCWNVHNIGNMKMIEDVKQVHASLGYAPEKLFSVTSSKRQSNQNSKRNEKNSDSTICYKNSNTYAIT